jgi:hypothetical protein
MRYLPLQVLLCISFALTTVAQAPTSRFSKYQKPVQIQELDWLLLRANLEALRNFVGSNSSGGINPPTVFFNQKTGRIEVVVPVAGDQLRALPLQELQSGLMRFAQTTEKAVQLVFRDIKDCDSGAFYLRFNDFDALARGSGFPTFADYEGCKLTVH